MSTSTSSGKLTCIKNHGEIHLFIGPMFSEKTTELQRAIRRYSRAGKKTVIMKYAEDDLRFGKDCVTHDGNSMEAFSVHRLMPSIFEVVVDKECQVIGIDEGQFFSDLVPFCQALVKRGKIVVVAALDGTFERKPFPPIVDLIPYCKKVRKLSAICALCGEEAAFTRRLNEEKKVEIIGGSDLYHANCEDCFNLSLEDYLRTIELKEIKEEQEKPKPVEHGPSYSWFDTHNYGETLR